MCACRGTSGFAHVSCLAEQVKILVAEAEENNVGAKAFDERWARWDKCGLCEQEYHGAVCGALGWACWKAYLGRPETNWAHLSAMRHLGNGLFAAGHHEDALSVEEAELSMARRLGASESNILAAQGNLASSYTALGRDEQALSMRRDVYSGCLKLYGEGDARTLTEANNYAATLKLSLKDLDRFEEAKSLLRKMIPVAPRVLGENNEITLNMRWVYAEALYRDPGATLDHLREAVTTLEDAQRTARRVLGGAHPVTTEIEGELRDARTTLRFREAAARPAPGGN